jgi:Uma2 family endonuclease
MGAVTTLAHGGPFTRDDLASIPEDGRRYELLDGSLLVTPAPSVRHQIASARLFSVLDTSRPDDVLVLCAPLDVALEPSTVLQPDVLVARRADFTDKDLPVAPLLAVEILSPSTRLIDLNLKKAKYEAAGCSSYWVVDTDEPSLTAWELHAGRYAEVAHAVGDETFTALAPYPVAITPDHLVD